MKILIYGAGALGSVLASKLLESGQEVTLLSRGERLESLRKHGLVLHNWVSGEESRQDVETIEAIHPERAYDLAIAAVGAHKLPPVLKDLRELPLIPSVLVVGNYAADPMPLIQALGKDRLLMGFFLASATITDGKVYVADYGPERKLRMVIGEPDGEVTDRIEKLAGMFEAAGFSVQVSEDIDAWLKTHAAMIVPLTCGVYSVGGDYHVLADTPDGMLLVVRGIQEAFAVQRRLGIPILPKSSQVISGLPEPVALAFLRRFSRQPDLEYVFAHTEHLRGEITCLAEQMATMAQQADLPTPSLDRLFAALHPASEPIPQGSRDLRLSWKWLLPWVALPVAVAAVIGIKNLRKRK